MRRMHRLSFKITVLLCPFAEPQRSEEARLRLKATSGPNARTEQQNKKQNKGSSVEVKRFQL